jgi:hypothetical protein
VTRGRGACGYELELDLRLRFLANQRAGHDQEAISFSQTKRSASLGGTVYYRMGTN